MRNKAFPDAALLRVEALQGEHFGPVSLRLAPRECVAIHGPSGAGKTLFLRALAELDPSQGEVWLDGVERSTVPAPAWRNQVGFLPAESHWWARTVAAHFTAGADGALPALGFEPEAMDWEISRLSSGERQRLALLRLLSNRPRALLLDEPTANLDAVNRKRCETLVRDYLQRNNACAFWVSHDTEQARRVADRTLRFAGGRLDANCG